MCNLGLYKTMVVAAKACGGPVQLLALVAVGGYLTFRAIEAGITMLTDEYF